MHVIYAWTHLLYTMQISNVPVLKQLYMRSTYFLPTKPDKEYQKPL